MLRINWVLNHFGGAKVRLRRLTHNTLSEESLDWFIPFSNTPTAVIINTARLPIVSSEHLQLP